MKKERFDSALFYISTALGLLVFLCNGEMSLQQVDAITLMKLRGSYTDAALCLVHDKRYFMAYKKIELAWNSYNAIDLVNSNLHNFWDNYIFFFYKDINKLLYDISLHVLHVLLKNYCLVYPLPICYFYLFYIFKIPKCYGMS